jgi:hypothetical protein
MAHHTMAPGDTIAPIDYSCNELDKHERLTEIVISSRTQPLDAILDCAKRA